MTARMTTILGWLTLIAVLIAVWLLFGEAQQQQKTTPGGHEKLYSALDHRINETRAIEIAGYRTAVHLKHEGEDWRLAEKDGYPADPEKVRRMLKGLVRTEIVARKTDKSKYYARLELDPKHEKRLILRTAGEGKDEGGTLVDLHVGKRMFIPRQRRFETFVRREGEARVLLVTGLPEIKAEAGTWLPDSILDLDFARVRSLVIHHTDGETLTIRRDAPGGDFAFVEMKQGEVYKGYRPTDHVVNALGYVALKDVRPAAGFESRKPAAVIEVTTFDGLMLKMALYPADDQTDDHWLLLDASVEPETAALAKRDAASQTDEKAAAQGLGEGEGELAADSGSSGKNGKESKEGKEGTEGKEGKEGKEGTEGTEGTEGKEGKEGKGDGVQNARDTVAQARRLRHLTHGWALLIPASTVRQLLVHREDLVRSGEPKGGAKQKTGQAKGTGEEKKTGDSGS